MKVRPLALTLLLAATASISLAQTPIAPSTLKLIGVTAETVTYKGKPATRIVDPAPESKQDDRLAILPNIAFTNGTLDVDLTGDTAPDANVLYRGFVGLAFRASADASTYECLYIRPKNGRSPDQLQRNHSTQYISAPGYPWQKLRTETPGKYESYVDLVPGEWTHLHIEVAGNTARLYVNAATQPTLLITDLKQPIVAGSIALWIGPGTIAHFANLVIKPAP